jgi:hypothetical protein
MTTTVLRTHCWRAPASAKFRRVQPELMRDGLLVEVMPKWHFDALNLSVQWSISATGTWGSSSSSGKIYGKDPRKWVVSVSFGTKTANPGFLWIFVA